MLDALLDTRIGLIRKDFGEELADQILSNPTYRNRKSDEFHLIDPRVPSTFSLRYSGRGDELLDFSKSTLMIPYLYQLLSKLQIEVDSNNPIIKNVQVIINTYPYKLSEVQAKLISLGISTALRISDVCEMVYLEPREMTKGFIEENNILHLILYDFDEWVRSALPDQDVRSLEELGLSRMENVAVTAAKLAVQSSKEDEVRKEFDDHAMGDVFDEFTLLPWNLLFELDLLPPVFYTQYDENLKEMIMTNVSESNKAIDVEVGLIGEVCQVFEICITRQDHLRIVPERLREIGSELPLLFADPTDENIEKSRRLISEIRYLSDVLSDIVPTQPAVDFERFIDSKMSAIDSSIENSKISEEYWNNKGVKCHRRTRDIKALGREGYLLVVHEDVTDTDGVVRRKGELLPSVMVFEPPLEKLTPTEVEVFRAEVKNGDV